MQSDTLRLLTLYHLTLDMEAVFMRLSGYHTWSIWSVGLFGLSGSDETDERPHDEIDLHWNSTSEREKPCHRKTVMSSAH
jgi:hypothetical protein